MTAMRLCWDCAIALSPVQQCFYVDDANYAVTRNSPAYCGSCYERRFGSLTRHDPDAAYRIYSNGVLHTDNLLLSGDYEDRVEARSRFMVRPTADGWRVA